MKLIRVNFGLFTFLKNNIKTFISLKAKKIKTCNQWYLRIFRLFFFIISRLGQWRLSLLIILILIKRKLMACARHASPSGRHSYTLNSMCTVIPCPNTTFWGSVRSLSLCSSRWCHMCGQKSSGCTLVDFFLLLPLFSLSSPCKK